VKKKMLNPLKIKDMDMDIWAIIYNAGGMIYQRLKYQ